MTTILVTVWILRFKILLKRLKRGWKRKNLKFRHSLSPWSSHGNSLSLNTQTNLAIINILAWILIWIWTWIFKIRDPQVNNFNNKISFCSNNYSRRKLHSCRGLTRILEVMTNKVSEISKCQMYHIPLWGINLCSRNSHSIITILLNKCNKDLKSLKADIYQLH